MSEMSTVRNLQIHLDNILTYTKQYNNLINSHMVNYLTDQLWAQLIPTVIQEEIQSVKDIENAIEIFWNYKKDDSCLQQIQSYGNFRNFLKESAKYNLENLLNVSITRDELQESLIKLGCKPVENLGLQIKEFMTEKKQHEVEITAELIATLSSYTLQSNESDENSSKQQLFIIDAGDGKGYLSSRLALEYKLKVLGIDANSSNSLSALQRNVKLEKAWNGLTNRAIDIKNGIKPMRQGRKRIQQIVSTTTNETAEQRRLPNYQTITHFISSDSNLLQLIHRNFPNERHQQSVNILLSGLHTCGNLASSCYRIFLENPDIHVLCNIGCCYHLLSEEFKTNELYGTDIENSTDYGFPLSQYLRKQEFSLGRNARMLAAQSINRTINAKELPSNSLFYRALLELLIQENTRSSVNQIDGSIQFGRIKKIDNFIEYFRKCSEKVNFDWMTKITDHELDGYQLKHLYDQKLIQLFHLLRMTFSSVIETILLLDRQLYLLENGIENVYIVKLFNPIVSPRCYGIVAVKSSSSTPQMMVRRDPNRQHTTHYTKVNSCLYQLNHRDM